MREPFAPRNSLRSSLRTSPIWLALPLLLVTACGGSAIADSQWGSTGFPDKLLPPPPWYQAWATEQAKLNPDPVRLATVRAERLIWEAQSGRSVDALKADYDEATFAQAGQMILDAIGYDELMRRAEQVGWVEWAPVKQSQSAVDKKFIGQELSTPIANPPPILKPPPLAKPPPSPNVSAIAKAAGKRVMTRAAPAALIASQADSPLPGLGDGLAVGIMAVALLTVGAITVYEIVTTPADEPTTAAPAPASATQPHAASVPPTAKPRKYPNQTCEDDERERLDDEMHEICNNKKRGFAAKCNPKKERVENIPCSAIKLSIQQRQACLAARWKVQNKCFGGKPDVEHQGEIDNV